MATKQTDGAQRITDEQLEQLRANANELAVCEARAAWTRATLHLRIAEILQAHNADPASEIDTSTGEIRPRGAL